MTGIVRGFEVTKNRDGTKNILMLKVEISGPDDVQSVEYMSHAGDDHIPPIDSIVIVLQAGKAWKIAIASNEGNNFDSSLNEGERKLYAPGGAYIKLLDDGKIELNGNTDFAVAFNDLKAGFDQFRVDYNAHFHTETGTVTTVPTVFSIASIDSAKVAGVKLP
jgi:phage gp45-like